MDVTGQKSYSCKENNCDIAFTNGNHPSINSSKHEMVLNLDSGKSGMFNDQTPTPTRLIKNCEEVGLFDDLKHVNPFEETFRRAVEQKNSFDIVVTSRITQNNGNGSTTEQDSLHTPQVYPIEEESTARDFPILNNGILLNEDLELDCRQKQKNSASNMKTKLRRISSKSERPILPNNSKTMIVSNAISLVQPQLISFSFPASNSLVPVQTVHPINTTNSSNSNPSQVPVKERLKTLLNSSLHNSGKRKLNHNVETESKKHCSENECMERRRAAASRYRHKIKIEHAELKKKNDSLIEENTQLKSILRTMQEVLSRHHNCDVTQAEQANGTMNSNFYSAVPQIEIPPSKVRLVMNIPKLIIQPNGSTPHHKPITLDIEKY